MDLDELLFTKIAFYFKRKRKNEAKNQTHRADLDTLRPKFTILSRAFSGQPIEVLTAEREGGWKNKSFFLPDFIGFLPTLEENISFYLFRILYLTIQQKLGFNWSNNESKTLIQDQEQALNSSLKVLHELFIEYPKLEKIHERLLDFVPVIIDKNKQEKKDLSWLYGKWMVNDKDHSVKDLVDVSGNYKEKNLPTPKTEIKAKPSESIEVLEVDKKMQEEYVINHNFEKVETAEEFSGVWRDFDGDDTLSDDANALEELNMKHVVRVDDPAHSIYQAEFTENATIAESSEAEPKGFFKEYDEWDIKKKAYKKSFCKVFPKKVKGDYYEYYKTTVTDNKKVLNGLRKMLTNINNKYNQFPRQPTGDEFDIDALIDLYADIHSGHTPSENIYHYKKKKEKDLSILLLLDVSLSSDGYAANNRILDVEKQTALLFGEIMNEYNIDFEVAGFFSKTRNFCTYLTLKGFDEPWVKGRNNIGAVQPTGYTRIGGALRHAGS
ncbi:MAG: NorD protein, partial [Cyclobacteriaceae bacterium]|nr:NorD protein [Cyclobacteriaceae bacterium]